MIGAGRIAERRPYATVLLGNQVFVRQAFAGSKAPLVPHLLVQILGKRLGKSVGQRLDHDGPIVVAIRFDLFGQFIAAVTGRHGKRSDVIGRHSAVCYWCHVIRQTAEV